MTQPKNAYLNAFEHECFEKYEMKDIPVDRECFLMDAKWLREWEKAHIAQSEGRDGDPYVVGYISWAAVHSVSDTGIDLSWFPNVYEHAARSAIRVGDHSRFELYLDEDFFRSLRVTRDGIGSASYIPKMKKGSAEYFYAQCDELLSRYESYLARP